MFYRVCTSLHTQIIHNFFIKSGQYFRYNIQIIISFLISNFTSTSGKKRFTIMTEKITLNDPYNNTIPQSVFIYNCEKNALSLSK